MKLKLGQKIEIEGIKMTVILIMKGFSGISYNLAYWHNGERNFVSFPEKELDAIGAKILN